MKLLGRTTSFNVQKILWFLDELGMNYEHIELGGRFGGLGEAEFIKLNPHQKVPVLLDEDKSIWESHTILRYLAASYGNEYWYPICPYERSLSDRWLDWSQTIFQPAFMGTFWGYYRKSENKRDMKAIKNDLDICKKCLTVISQQLNRFEYLAGENMSLADIVVGSVLYRLTTQGLDVELPNLVNGWYQKLSKRPGLSLIHI